MCEARNAVAGLEVLGDFRADLHDGAHVVAADGAAFALLAEGGDVDVLPVGDLRLVRDLELLGSWRSLPVGRVESDCVDFYEDVVVSHSG